MTLAAVVFILSRGQNQVDHAVRKTFAEIIKHLQRKLTHRLRLERNRPQFPKPSVLSRLYTTFALNLQ